MPSTSITLHASLPEFDENTLSMSKFSSLENIHSPYPVGAVDTKCPEFRNVSAAISRSTEWHRSWSSNVGLGADVIGGVVQYNLQHRFTKSSCIEFSKFRMIQVGIRQTYYNLDIDYRSRGEVHGCSLFPAIGGYRPSRKKSGNKINALFSGRRTFPETGEHFASQMKHALPAFIPSSKPATKAFERTMTDITLRKPL